MMRIGRSLLAGVVLCTGSQAAAHEFRPSLLDLRETAPGNVASVFHVARWANGYQNIQVVPPAGCARKPEPTEWEQDYQVRREQWSCAGGLTSTTLSVIGLDRHGTDVVIQATLADGARLQGLATSTAPHFRLGADESEESTAWAYLAFGIHHVLGGADHVLFVIGMTLLASGRWQALIAAVTAFTAAHTLTLGLAALGHLLARQAPAEVVIAASVLLLALQIRKPRKSVDPWQLSIMAFVCGLFHGLGFAGAFRDIGVVGPSLWVPLASFNAGVEIAQIGVIVVVSAAVHACRAFSGESMLVRISDAAASAMGGIAIFWCAARFPVMFSG